MTRNDLLISNNPLGLVEVVQEYGVNELGGLFIYLPSPRKSADQSAWAWIEAMKLSKAVSGGPWNIHAKSAAARLAESHPKLFDGDPIWFEVYRLNQDRLAKLIR